MGREIFNEVKKQIISSDLDIAESEYDDATKNWYIDLETIRKIRIAWNSSNKYLSVEEATNDKDTGLITWQYIFASRLSNQHEILTNLESLLKTK